MDQVFSAIGFFMMVGGCYLGVIYLQEIYNHGKSDPKESTDKE